MLGERIAVGFLKIGSGWNKIANKKKLRSPLLLFFLKTGDIKKLLYYKNLEHNHDLKHELKRMYLAVPKMQTT